MAAGVIGGGAPYTKNGWRVGSEHIVGNSAYPRTPVYGGRIPEAWLVAAGAGSFLKGAGSFSLPPSRGG